MINLLSRALILLATMALIQPVMAEQYYKWVDDEGVTHYSAEKPEGRDASRVKAHNPPSSSQDQAQERLQQQREQTERERQAAREAEEEAEKREEDPEGVNKENCEQHRDNLKTLTNKPTVRRENPETGEMEVLNEEQRNAMIEKTKKALEQCNQNQQQE